MNIIENDITVNDDGTFEGFFAFDTLAIHEVQGHFFENYVDDIWAHVALTTPEGDAVYGPVNKGVTEAALDVITCLVEEVWAEGPCDDPMAYAEYLEFN